MIVNAVTRRSLLLSPLLAAAAAPGLPGVPPGRRIEFEVMRNGSAIGTHALTFTAEPDRLLVGIAIKIAVSLGPIVVFRYDMEGTETWLDGRFAALDTTTNDDGEHRRVSIRRTAEGLAVKSQGFPDTVASAHAAPLTHWSVAAFSGPMLSPQDGQPIPGTVRPAGESEIKWRDGRTVRARGYDIEIHTPTQDWYDEAGVWVGLHAKIKDGSALDYERTA